MKKTYKAAIIGTGGIAHAHANGYKGMGRTELVAGADVRREQLDKFKADTGLERLYTDTAEMLEKERPDIVSICTWADSHYEIVRAVLAAGTAKAIVCEKPIALGMGDAYAIVAACEKAGVKLANMHQRRLVAQHQETKKLLDAGAIGKIVRAWASVTPYYKDPLVWSTHVADMLRFYAGDADWVMGQIGEVAPEPQRQGNYRFAFPYAGYLQMKSGARVLLEQESGPCQIHLFGETGQIVVHMDQWKDQPPLRVLRDDTGWECPSLESYKLRTWDAFAAAMGDVVESIEQDREPWDTGRDGAAALEIILAIYESARVRARVALPMQMMEYPIRVMMSKPRGASKPKTPK